MTLQEIYDKIKDHLLSQGRRARTRDRNSDKQICAYRGEGGSKCAIGALISDEHYTPELEGKAWDEAHVLAALSKSGIGLGLGEVQSEADRKLCYLLGAAQDIHDNSNPENWKDALACVAEEQGLVA